MKLLFQLIESAGPKQKNNLPVRIAKKIYRYAKSASQNARQKAYLARAADLNRDYYRGR